MKNKSFLTVFISFVAMQIVAVNPNSIFYAVSQRNTRCLEKILKNNPDITQTNDDGQTILHVAVLSNNWKAMKLIIQSGFANINQLDRYGKTAMDYAAEYGYNKIIRKLYKHNGKVTSIDNARYAQKVITRPFKILLCIGIALFAISMIFVSWYIDALNPAVYFGPHGRGIHLAVSGVLATFFGVAAGSLIIPGVSGWAYRSSRNLSLVESIA